MKQPLIQMSITMLTKFNGCEEEVESLFYSTSRVLLKAALSQRKKTRICHEKSWKSSKIYSHDLSFCKQ